MAASLFKWLSGPILSLFVALPLLSASGHEPKGWNIGSGREDDRNAAHPLYISVTEINHNVKDKILEVSCKIFTSDLETVLEKMTGAKVDLSSPKDKVASDKLIAVYVERHLRLKVDGKAVQLHFAGSENEEDGTWSYYQVNDILSAKRIEAANDLLYDNFPQQINIMHVTVGGQRQSTRLDCPAANATFQY